MPLNNSTTGKRTAPSASEQPSAELNTARQRIELPNSQGGIWRLTQKLRKEGILGPTETIRQHNRRLDAQADINSVIAPDPERSPEGIEIESHRESETTSGGFGGLLAKATNALRGEELPKSNKKVTPRAREDFSVLVVSLITLLVAAIRIRESAKPNQEEINLFSDHLAGILLRHLPVNSKMSADAVDLIGMIAVIATWYSRVHEDLRTPAQPQASQPVTVPYQDNGHAKPLDPISQISPEAGSFLNRIASASEGSR